MACGPLLRQSDGFAELKRMFVRDCLRGRSYGKILRGLLCIADAEALTLRLEAGV